MAGFPMEQPQFYRGVLKSFSPRDGYGFIHCVSLLESFGRDVYIDRSRLPLGASAGDQLEFTITISNKGQPQVLQARMVEESPQNVAEAAQALDTSFLQFAEGVTYFSVVLEKHNNISMLGIDVDTAHGDDLMVDNITGGLILQWNRRHPQRQVKIGDCIVKVNNVSGKAQAIFTECRDAMRLEMTLRRGPPPDAKGAGKGARSVLPSVCVVTWNVLSSAYANFKMYPQLDPSVIRAPRRRAQIAAALQALAADVVCLQEVDCPLEELGLNEMEFDSCSAQRPGGRPDRCVIAWRKDRLEQGPAGHRVLMFDDHPPPKAFEPDPEHYESGNVGLAVELRVRSDPGKHCVTFATTHLNWEPRKSDVRAWQAHVFFDLAASLSGSRIVLCGDFNSQPGTQPHLFLSQGCGLASVYADVEASGVTNSNSNAPPKGFAGMIDYIWYSPKWFTVKQRLRLPLADDLRTKAYGPGWAAGNNNSNNSGNYGGGCHGQRDLPPVPTLLSESWPSDHLALAAVFEFAIPTADEVDYEFH
mmetsp:Transcript_32341/g.94628  ORF Transcript_32341/g.94628 Transcript_32341/m.94628 type:complete len:530 (-) Transcript_32341:38-1627(-)